MLLGTLGATWLENMSAEKAVKAGPGEDWDF